MTTSIKFLSVRRVQALCVLLALILGATTSWGQNLNVNVQYDSASSDLVPPIDVSTTVGGNTTLRSAIQYANFHHVDTIFVPPGTYKLTLTGVNEDSAAKGDLDINSSLTVVGSGSSNTFIDGNGIDRVFDINPKNVGSTSVTITDLTIRKGASAAGQNGGGIYVHTSTKLRLDTVNVNSNVADQYGGGIADSGTVIMNGGAIDSNMTTNVSGGGGYFFAGTDSLRNVEIKYNYAANSGGGVGNEGSSNVVIAGGTIANNQAPNNLGGGIHSGGNSLAISNAQILTNSAYGGGGLSVYGNTNVSSTTFKWNIATQSGAGFGGGIFQGSSALTLTNCALDSNSSDYQGGAIFVYSAASDSWTGITIDSCSATSDGGAIYDVNGGINWNGGSMTNCRALGGAGTAAFTNTNLNYDNLTNFGSTAGNSPTSFVGNINVTVLAVELLSLKANCSGGTVTLSWQTATEIDNAGFNVLRRAVSETAFTEIAGFESNSSLRGAGTSTAPIKYSFTDNSVASGLTYTYKIQSVSTTGAVKDGKTVTVTVGIPRDYALYQNFPNPFNPSTTVRFDLKQPSTVTLEVYNVLGQQMISENRGLMGAGTYSEDIDMSRFASGVYFYRIAAIGANGEKFVALKRMMLVK